MDDEIKNYLKLNKIFSALDAETINNLYLKFSKQTLTTDEILYYQGSVSDYLYILIEGKLIAELTTVKGEKNLVGHIVPGEPVGELGVLTNEPRSLTIKALTDCILLKLSATAFIELCHQYPSVLLNTIQPIITRSSNIIYRNSIEKRNKQTVIIAAHEEINLEQFSNKLLELSNEYPSLVTISDYQKECQDKANTPTELKEYILSLSKDKKSSHRILYILKSCETSLAKLAFKNPEMIYFAAHHDSEVKIDPQILNKISNPGFNLKNNPDLIILHPNDNKAPQGTAAWLALTNIALTHHIRVDRDKDWKRLLRFIRGKAVGVVLGGGGTRGWAHLGALKALRKSKIPIDIIGGTSVGAIIAASYAINDSFEDIYYRFSTIVNQSNKSVSWRSLTWPLISLFNAKNFTLSQQEAFGDLKIEDLWLPFFCISCNLRTNQETIHNSGLLWEKTRASSALPGIIPPMVIDGDLHLDGGLLNNLPVDIMRQFVGLQGKVIAVDLNPYVTTKTKYHFPPVLTFTDALRFKFSATPHKFKFPRFLDTFIRAMFVGSLAKTKQNSFSANTFVSLQLNTFRLLYSDPKKVAQLIEVGYKETLAKCNQHKER